jgi:hypothetical protein
MTGKSSASIQAGSQVFVLDDPLSGRIEQRMISKVLSNGSLVLDGPKLSRMYGAADVFLTRASAIQAAEALRDQAIEAQRLETQRLTVLKFKIIKPPAGSNDALPTRVGQADRDQSHHAELRQLLARSNLSAAAALERFNAAEPPLSRPYSLTAWRTYLADPGAQRWRRIPDAVIERARIVFRKR